MEKLSQQKCIPCEAGTLPLTEAEAKDQIGKLAQGWELKANEIQKLFTFKNFVESMTFVNKVADIAERNGHHPDFSISYNKVIITLTTHAINGLSINDFIVASKIDQIS